MISQVQRFSLYFAWIVSIVATLGSLYLSEVLQFIPCSLCWYQRIFMYPQVILLGIATYRQDRDIAFYSLPLTIIGGSISTYHYLVQKVPAIGEMQECSVISCTGDPLNWWNGWVTVPFLCLIAFILITIFVFIYRSKK